MNCARCLEKESIVINFCLQSNNRSANTTIGINRVSGTPFNQYIYRECGTTCSIRLVEDELRALWKCGKAALIIQTFLCKDNNNISGIELWCVYILRTKALLISE